MKRTIFATVCALAGIATLHATTVIPPNFGELVGQAELIFQGSVTNVRSEFVGEGGQRHIQSYVTFKVEDVIKGKPGASYTLSMLGGTVGEQTMEVTDAPKFKLGDRDILFVEHNGEQIVPLVGIMHGRFRVQHEQQTGRDIVTTHDGRPLTDLGELGQNTRSAVAAERAPLSPADFKAAIQNKIRTSSPAAREP